MMKKYSATILKAISKIPRLYFGRVRPTHPSALPNRESVRRAHPALFSRWLLISLGMGLLAHAAQAERIKDIASIAGVRSNQLVGYGLVVGLDGTGDQTSQAPFTVQSMASMLAQLGITLPPGSNPQLKNVAAVSVHA